MIRKTVFAVATVAAIGGNPLIPTEASAGSGGKAGGMGGGHHGYWGGHWGRGFVALAFAVLVLGAATTASARPKNHIAEHTATTATNCYGTPVIMQGMDCPTRL